jgi:hypothetical protein
LAAKCYVTYLFANEVLRRFHRFEVLLQDGVIIITAQLIRGVGFWAGSVVQNHGKSQNQNRDEFASGGSGFWF